VVQELHPVPCSPLRRIAMFTATAKANGRPSPPPTLPLLCASSASGVWRTGAYLQPSHIVGSTDAFAPRPEMTAIRMIRRAKDNLRDPGSSSVASVPKNCFVPADCHAASHTHAYASSRAVLYTPTPTPISKPAPLRPRCPRLECQALISGAVPGFGMHCGARS